MKARQCLEAQREPVSEVVPKPAAEDPLRRWAVKVDCDEEYESLFVVVPLIGGTIQGMQPTSPPCVAYVALNEAMKDELRHRLPWVEFGPDARWHEELLECARRKTERANDGS